MGDENEIPTILTYFGKNIEELTREELILAIKDLFTQCETYRSMAESSNQMLKTVSALKR